jgi:hypothetical protein
MSEHERRIRVTKSADDEPCISCGSMGQRVDIGEDLDVVCRSCLEAALALLGEPGLPVVTACVGCALFMAPDATNPIDYGWCGHDNAPGSESFDAKVNADDAPPSWCPLRTSSATRGEP